MSAVTVRGLAALQRRLKAPSVAHDVAQAVRQEAESLAEAARETAPGALGETIEIRDQSRESRPVYEVGTPHPAARYLEFGTTRRPASPWLRPLFWARSGAIKERLGKILVRTLRGL